MKSLKHTKNWGENVTDYCTAILVDAERLESDGAFKPVNLGYITYIFKDHYDSIFRLWEIQKYKDVTELSINFMCVTCISYHQRSSSPMSPFYKRLRVNTAILSIKISGKWLQASRSIKTNLCFRGNTL